MNNHDREQLFLWVEKQLDDSLDPGESDQLQRVLMANPEARELYLDLMQQNAHLQLERVHLSAVGRGPVVAEDEPPPLRGRPGRRNAWLAAMIGLAAMVLLAVWWNFPDDDAPATTPFVAQIIDSSDAEWGDSTLPTAVGSNLHRGRLRIERGLTTIRFASGAEVTLESPAELEIQSSFRGRLLAGTAVVQVPESAHGFTLSTPTAVAIDHGTAFAVTIERSSQVSSIEVLDGEVEVQHVGSDAMRRLSGQQRVVATVAGLRDSPTHSGEPELMEVDRSDSQHQKLHRITTADGRGRDGSISRSQADEVKNNSRDGLVLVKNPYDGYERYSRKGYFAFDLGSLNGDAIATAKFVLTLQPSGFGFASQVGDCEFVVYGLADESGDDWSPQTLNWQTAPANAEGAADVDAGRARELGRFVVRRGRQHGQVWIAGDALVDFLNADTNGIVTLIVVRATKERSPGGLVHGFANRSNAVAAPPALLVGPNSP
ncbi:FecR protein [Stieleria maiorica]|uniref:FecR protein n=1 Tax=Stieleria maiorica TaxID=2795974 RepID=A0A5B9MIB0_9BACT|nr:FecR domain-containing protein [Stieleria maiorica]QEG00250.1 FecR protein [Stieleria maiorica]